MDTVPEKLTIPLFDAVLEFMLSNPTAEQIIAYRLPSYLEDRLHDLLDNNSEGQLFADEKAELDEFRQIDHIFTMLKARARHKLKSA